MQFSKLVEETRNRMQKSSSTVVKEEEKEIVELEKPEASAESGGSDCDESVREDLSKSADSPTAGNSDKKPPLETIAVQKETVVAYANFATNPTTGKSQGANSWIPVQQPCCETLNDGSEELISSPLFPDSPGKANSELLPEDESSNESASLLLVPQCAREPCAQSNARQIHDVDKGDTPHDNLEQLSPDTAPNFLLVPGEWLDQRQQLRFHSASRLYLLGLWNGEHLVTVGFHLFVDQLQI